MDECPADEHDVDDQAESSITNDSIAMICHEIRNPIAALQNGIELVASDSLDCEARARTAEMMQRQLRHVVRLLDDLGNGVLLTSERLQIKREPVDLARVSAYALDTIGRLIEARRQELSITLPPVGTVWVQGDQDRLVEVIVNLLANAAKYTNADGRIWLELTADSGTATLTVRDSGIGIAKEFIPRIFDLFTQGECMPGAGGLGIGLPLVRNLLQLHGGEISASSEGEGLGSEFVVRLPLLRVTEASHSRSAGASNGRSNGHSLSQSQAL